MALATSLFVLSRAWRYSCCLPPYPGPVSCFLLSNNSTDWGSSSDRWVVPYDSLHKFLSQLQASMYETATTQFQRRLPLVVSERIFGRRFLQNCAELPRQSMLPIVFCSVSFGQSFAFGSTGPVVICTGSGGD